MPGGGTGTPRGDVGIIGAGMAGLACASRLAKAGIRPVLFDKGRGPGGRMATRRAEVDGETVRFDHGAQYFTVRDPAFAQVVAAWKDDGVAADWPAASEDAVVGLPAMNAPVRHMAEALDVHWSVRIDALKRTGEDWLLHAAGARHRFGRVVVAIPPEQAADLLSGHQPRWAERARASVSKPCWTVMAAFAQLLPVGDTFRGNAVGWAARNSAKPGRGEGEHWVVQASPEWSQEHLEGDQGAVADALMKAFWSETGATPQIPVHIAAHRWRYAKAQPQPGEISLWDAEAGLGACGDWLSGPRVENAWLSGDALAEAMLG